MANLRWKFLFILVIAIIGAYLAAPLKSKPPFKTPPQITLGIDLQGGAELRYRVVMAKDDPDRTKKLGRTIDVISKRINIKGLKEPKINSYGDDEIIVQLAGVDMDKVREYKELFKTIGKLELKEVGDKELHKNHPPSPDTILSGYIALRNSEKGGDWLGQYEYIWVKENNVVTGEQIENAYSEASLQYGWVVNFALNEEGKKAFAEATSRLASENQEKKGHIAILLDGKLYSRPGVEHPITGGRGFIYGNFTPESAEQLAIVLRSGSLPASIESVAENFVGPTLGQDSIKKGFLASIIAFIGVALFMVIYYRGAGFIANISLILNGVFLLAIMSILGATLTLPGIAGIALTMGMAVDANILIFERIREERAKGKTPFQSFEAGRERATVTIIDANITTLFAGLLLYYFGTGAIQGFGVTLSIGILTTLFTAVWCSNVFLRMAITSGTIKEFKMMRLFEKPNIGFVKAAKLAITLSIIAIIAGIFFFVRRGEDNFGMDFRGGSTITINFNENQKIEDIRNAVRGLLVKNEKGIEVSKYPDAEIQTMAPQEAGLKSVGALRSESTLFQIRLQNQNINQIKDDLQKVFADKLSHEPFEEMPDSEFAGYNEREDFYKGGGTYVYVKAGQEFNLDTAKQKIKDTIKTIVEKDPVTNEPKVMIEKKEGAPKSLVKLKLIITQKDKDADKLQKIKDALKNNSDIPLSLDPFLHVGNIGKSVAEEFTESAIKALICSWVIMIIYIWIRFHYMAFGIAAVIALIHDALISIGAVAFCGLVVPESWGFNFELNLSSLAAILTIMGYSVNDTIVIFDRIRENLGLMKRETFSNIVNTSVNQTLSRTIITSFATWISVVLLYIITLGSSGGIENLAFPLIVGLIAGSYSTVYIASPLLLIWYKKGKPEMTR